MLLTQDAVFGFAVAGVIVSLALEYFPRLSVWYNALADNIQKLIVLGSGLVVVLGAFGLDCLGFVVDVESWVCTTQSLFSVLSAYLVFIASTQGTYLITPKSTRE
jgi:hypothetical protein